MLALHSRILVVYSKTDPASKNIAQHLIDNHSLVRERNEDEIYRRDNVRLASLDKLCIYAAPDEFPSDIDSIIFASKHVSSTGKPALAVHTTGNLTTSADFGGNPEEVAFVDPTIVRRVLRGLRDGASREGRILMSQWKRLITGQLRFLVRCVLSKLAVVLANGRTRCLARLRLTR